jgi:hypothetical protein
MAPTLVDIARAISGSGIHDAALYLLSNVPGFPPIVQTLHILSVASILGSIAMIDLRLLGIAVRSQGVDEMIRRLMPWTWWALPVLLLSGGTLVAARPMRYFANPVFGIKFALLLPAILLAGILQLEASRHTDYWQATASTRRVGKVLAGFSLLLWIAVILAGRWIAYADYLFPEGA